MPTYMYGALLFQAVMLSLDIREHYRDCKIEKRPLFKNTSIVFLVGVFLVFSVIQFGLLLLAPHLENVYQTFMRLLSHYPSLFNFSHPSAVFIYTFGIVCFYIAGFFDYVVHRVLHSRKLFILHEYHHLPNTIFLALPGFSARPFSFFSTIPPILATIFCVSVILHLLGLNAVSITPLVSAILFIHAFILVITHSAFCLKFPYFDRLLRQCYITSPREHRLHHGAYLQGNYGNITTLWDRLFGTYLDPDAVENQNPKLGLSYDQDYLGVITAGLLKLPKDIRVRFQLDRYINIES